MTCSKCQWYKRKLEESEKIFEEMKENAENIKMELSWLMGSFGIRPPRDSDNINKRKED